MPGLGHLYAGSLLRAAVAWLGSLAVAVPIFWVTVRLPLPQAAFVPWVSILAMYSILAVDAVRTARRAPDAYVRRPYNRWYIYLAAPFVSWVLVGQALKRYVNGHIYETYRIPVGTMAPTLLAGDLIYAIPIRGPVRRGDIVVYRTGGRLFVKRVVAIGGDTIAMHNDSLFVNTRFVPEPYAMTTADSPSGTSADFRWQRAALLPSADRERYDPTSATWGPLSVRDRTYFVLSDNRGNSLDSRFTGPVDADSVFRRPVAVYFSRDPDSGEIRWSRIGRPVDR
jgi:signal peptidase I